MTSPLTTSGATALKYFKDSPLVLGIIEQPESRAAVLEVGLEMADQDANVTLEYVRTAPGNFSDSDLRPVTTGIAIHSSMNSR